MLTHCSFVVALLGLSACSVGGVGEAVRPDAPAAAAAIDGKPIKCVAGELPATPLIVDWKSNHRTDLEVAMKSGVAVVAYDCGRLELLAGCRVEGGYSFAGVARKEETVQLVNNDEIAANIPLSKATLGAELVRGSSIDLALVMVGKKGTTVAAASRPQLTGSCAGATHFVRGAFVGAFAVATGTAGKVRAVADIFGAGVSASSTSDRNTNTKDGDLEACRASSADAAAPPGECQSAIRLELVPIAAKPTAAAPTAEADSPQGTGLRQQCPAPLVWANGKCSSSGGAHLCTPGDVKDCQKQCELGDPGSCYNRAVLLEATEPDVAMPLFEAACAKDLDRACQAAGWIWLGRRNGAKDDDTKTHARIEAEKYLARACELGEAWTCWNTAHWYLRTGTLEVFPRDPARASSLYRRSCALGYAPGCSSLADFLISGKDVKRDVPAALAVLLRGCDGGVAQDCTRLGDLQREGKMVLKDPERALEAYRRGCDAGGAIACHLGGRMLAAGEGLAKDAAGAVAIWSKACNDKIAGWDACNALGTALEKGAGVKADTGAAAQAYERGCVKGQCARAGEIWEKGIGVPADPAKAFAAYLKGCQRTGDKAACKAAKRLGVVP